ncbi:outer membrane beta-barrel protein [Phenylobacterium sp.]|uniref:outer membrane beta-barrel protein n=1 Tax=Phenylobacterium sp. TaxID=1871053 RepID=UPI0025DFEF64|nr:outer membrane beta-barrel protein [Phenylobacterium sp.]
MHFLKTMCLAGTAAIGLGLAAAPVAQADPLASPSMTAPLSANATPFSYDVGSFGKIYVSGQLTGLGYEQRHPVIGDKKSRADLSNAQIEIQKTDGVFQFYVQAGTYSLPSLGTAYIKQSDTPDLTYHYVPTAYVKIVPSANFNIEGGIIPTLIGAEYTFTFQNMNIARGLLWNQEPAISRGVQANITKGPIAASFALTDGYYSSHYATGSTLITYTISKTDTVAFAGSVPFSKTTKSRFATPVTLNNGDIFNLFWTHTEGAWMVEPYLQYGHVPSYSKAGILTSGSTYGAAVLGKYTFNDTFSLAARAEYEGSSGGTSLLYGQKSKAYSLTLTPTWQLKTFFVRGEFSYTGLTKIAPGSGFGSAGTQKKQTRAMIETGVLF